MQHIVYLASLVTNSINLLIAFYSFLFFLFPLPLLFPPLLSCHFSFSWSLQAVLPSFLSDRRLAKDKILTLRDRVRKLIWHLLTACSLDHTHPLLLETRRIVRYECKANFFFVKKLLLTMLISSRNCEALFLSQMEERDLISTLLGAGELWRLLYVIP